MTDTLIDSAIVIDYLRGLSDAVACLDAITASARPKTHVVVQAEILQGARNAKEQLAIDALFAAFEVIAPTDADAGLSIELLRRYRLSHGIGWLDALIAATALRMGLGVCTTNTKHFAPIPNLRVIRPY